MLYLGGKPYTVTRSRKRDNERITVDCQGVHTMDQASRLTGETVMADESSVLKEGYPLPVHGFTGFTILSRGESFSVEEVEYNSSNPQLMVRGNGRTFPVPLNMALAGTVDAEGRTITVELPRAWRNYSSGPESSRCIGLSGTVRSVPHRRGCRRGISRGIASVELYDIRDHPVDRRGSIDDYQFGGGAGMIIRPEPLFDTLNSIPWRQGARVALMTPQGRRFDACYAEELALCENLIIFCGRYGGVDERFRREAVTDEICVGDAVVSGGEIPAMYVMDAVFRWLPGVLGRMESACSDSFPPAFWIIPGIPGRRTMKECRFPKNLFPATTR